MDTQQAEQTAREIIANFAQELAELREQHGTPSFERMHSKIKHREGVVGSRNTFQRMITQPKDIPRAEFVRGFVLALDCSNADADEWEVRRQQAQAALKRVHDLKDSAIAPADDAKAAEAPPSELDETPETANRPTSSSRIRPLLVGAVAASIPIFLLGFVVGRWSAPTPSSAPTVATYAPGAVRGQPDLQAACDAQFGPGRKATATNPDDASSWQCLAPGMAPDPGKNGIELLPQCAAQFPGTEPKALRNGDPYSWRCLQRG